MAAASPASSFSTKAASSPDEKNTVFFCCDIQEVFRSKIHRMPLLIASSVMLNSAAKSLGIPIIFTEQMPFAKTCAEIDTSAGALFQKTRFSMCIPEVRELLKKHAAQNVVLYGLEAHVCVTQTSLDLLREGLNVYLVADAVSSQNPEDREVALERLRQAGCTIVTSQGIVYEIMKDAKHPKFKEVLQAVKAHADARSKL